ncbi:uncharacterized protein TNCV_1004711 [Trichonephila clavipes]|nr:uncharacterized protein TNCV_1004711 [Trichonephila clavipes]
MRRGTPEFNETQFVVVVVDEFRGPQSDYVRQPCSVTRGLLATDNVILIHGQVTWTTLELAPPLLTTTPHQRDRFNVHCSPTRRVFGGTGLELVTRSATIRCLDHSATTALSIAA